MIGSKKDFPQVSINLLFHTKPGYLFIKYLFALEAKKELDEEPNWQGWKFIFGDSAGVLAPCRFPKINVYTSNQTFSTRVSTCVVRYLEMLPRDTFGWPNKKIIPFHPTCNFYIIA